MSIKTSEKKLAMQFRRVYYVLASEREQTQATAITIDGQTKTKKSSRRDKK